MNKEKILSELRTSFIELQDNFNILVSIQELFLKDWDLHPNPQTRKKVLLVSRNFSRQLHSYLASFDSFNEHLKAAKGRVKNTDASFVDDFDKQTRTTLTEKSVFIIQLRNFTLHRKLPMAGIAMNFLFTTEGLKTGQDCGVLKSLPSLQVADLLSYKKWLPSSKKILESNGDKIEIMRYVKEAHSEIVKLYFWCDARIRAI